MTAFQRPGFSDLTMVPVEDPMELSTDMERRLLGDEDIDIDLSLDGRSPYVQEDDYMLEDGHFTEDQILFDGEQGGNDDEMADEVEPLEESDKIQEDQPDDNAQDPDEFDILVDDEDIRVEDTVIFSDGTTGLPSMLPYSVNESSDQQNYSQFPDQYASKDTDETSQVLSHPDYTERKDGDFAHDYAPGLVEDTEIVTTTSDHADDPAYMMDHPGQNFTQKQHTIAQLPGDDLVGVSSDNPLESGATGQPLISTRDKAEGEEEGNNPRSDESVRHNQLDNGSPDRTSKGLRELAERKLSRNLGEPGNHTHIQSEDQGTSHRSPDEHEVVTEEVDATDGSFDEHFTDDSPEESSSPHDRMPLHPVIVVYQESEILLFPPHKHDGEQAETYFLEDESLAAQTIQALLRACRLVLADSINDHDELELQINSLGLEIRETSNSSTTTSLAQILDIYLKLHHNDGLADPDPLQMTLTTKLSFPHRLEYLLGAVAEGKGLLDVTKSSKAEYLGDFEEGSEYNGENLQETAAPFGSEAGGAVDEGSTLNEAHDWTVNDYHAPASDTNDYQELNPAGSPIGPALHEHAIDDQGQQAQIEEATGPSRVEVSKTNQTSQGSNTQLRQAVVYTAGDPAYHPPAQHIQTFHEASTVKNESKERSEAKHIASPASSTLKGDSSDFAGELDHGILPSTQSRTSENDYPARPGNQTGGEPLTVTGTEQSDRGDETYEEDDGDIFDLVEPEDIDQMHGADQDHGASSLDANRNQEHQDEHQDGSATQTLYKETSKGNSDINNDEITYEDEDDEDNITANHEAGTSLGDSPRPRGESASIDFDIGISGGHRDSLKRLRPGEDGELGQGDGTQESKRFRSA